MRRYWVYIMGNDRPTIYVGITNDLARRVYEHQTGMTEGFTEKYHLKKLLYFEESASVEAAIAREKQLKNWKREWKLELIMQHNPGMKDLSSKVLAL